MKPSPEPAGLPSIPPAERRYYLLTAGINGAAIMIVEILGAKLLAPYLGTSHFVWTAQIAVTMVALAIGYYLGGWLVDRSPRPTVLYNGVLIAATYLAASAFLVEKVAYACLELRLALGSLLAAAYLFLVPLGLLAMTGPFLIRVLASSLKSVGSEVGRLTAISTLGSFAGTLLIGYVLIPLLPNTTTLLLTSGILVALSLGYRLLFGARYRTGTLNLLLVVSVGMIGIAAVVTRPKPWRQMNELFRGNSHFGHLLVLETKEGTRRFYLNDYLVQNTYDTATKQSTSMFTYMLHGLARGYAAKTDRVLCIGLGVGIVPGRFAREGSAVDVVEINPAVIPVATKYFDFPADKARVVVGDGREFVNRTTNRYDAVVLDAFVGDSSPVHLMSRECFESIRRVLAPGGVLVMNVFGEFEPGKDYYIASIHKTAAAVFKQVRIHAAGNGNVFVVASAGEALEFKGFDDLQQVYGGCRHQVEDALARTPVPDPASGVLLTDDFNPLEFHDALNRERFRRQFAMGVKDL